MFIYIYIGKIPLCWSACFSGMFSKVWGVSPYVPRMYYPTPMSLCPIDLVERWLFPSRGIPYKPWSYGTSLNEYSTHGPKYPLNTNLQLILRISDHLKSPSTYSIIDPTSTTTSFICSPTNSLINKSPIWYPR